MDATVGIVVGVEPSVTGGAALRWAVREAVARDVPLTAVRAWLTPAFGRYYPPGSLLADGAPEAAVEAQVLADEQLKLAREQVPDSDAVEASAEAVMGAPARVLVDAGAEAAMIVVGSRGAGVLSRAVLGSVTTSVLHHAACPVVVVPEDHDGASRVRRVLVGVDHSPESLVALRFAADAARHHGAVLVPVAVHEPFRLAPGRHVDLAGLELNERRALLTAAADAGASDLQVEPEVLTGQPAGTLTTLAHASDLLVVGSRGRGGFRGLVLGSTSAQCAQHATCPVVVVGLGQVAAAS